MGPITITLVAILGVLLLIVLMQLFKKPAPPPTSKPVTEDLANLKPQDARAGDVISISGAGDNMTDLDFTADRCTWFEAGVRRWFELSGPYRERRVAMRVDTGDDSAVSIQADPRAVTLEDLGLSEDDLAEMDERQNTADSFDFDSKTWLYRLSREAQSSRPDQPQPVGFYYWEFREQNGGGILAVRKMQGEPFSVTRYTGIPAGDVTVYRGARV
jgi:hypothetical protein